MTEITRHQPFTPMRNLRRELDRLFSDFLPSFRDEEEGGIFSAVWAPRMDLSETEGEYLVKMDLPGIEKDAIDVNVEDNQLTVSGERKVEKREEKENHLRMERSYGSFYRRIPLPRSTKAEEVKAEFKNGVLHIRIPKAEEAKSRKVKVT